jgi:hypothetical protein
MADSTARCASNIRWDILSVWKNRLLSEITADDLRQLCAKIKDRGAPATIYVRDIVKQIYGFAILHGEKLQNPGRWGWPCVNCNFRAEGQGALADRDQDHAWRARACADPADHPARASHDPPHHGAESELQDATWDEVDENAVSTVPKERRKRSKPHNVYLSQQALDILIALKPAPGTRAIFCRPATTPARRCRARPSTACGSTLLNELGFNRDRIEKCLAHEDSRSSRGVYNKAEYEPQHCHMLQE